MFNLRYFPLIISLSFTGPIYAEDVEEIVVTALKRSSTVVDTPAAITAISSTEIEDKGITNMHDLKHLVPSMNFTNVLGAQNITIRGIGQFNGNPGVSVSTDGIFQSRAHSSQLGEMDTELFKEWFQAFSQSAGITLHIENLYGENNHHIIESCFKGLARALREAISIDSSRANEIPSTKGSL